MQLIGEKVNLITPQNKVGHDLIFSKMKSLSKKLILKLSVTVAFVATMGMGVFTSINVESARGTSNISLMALGTEVAQGESDCPGGCLIYKGHCFCYKYYPLRGA